MTEYENNIKACELLEQIQEEAGQLWGQCQYYGSDNVGLSMIYHLKQMLRKLDDYNRQMER